MLRAFSFAPWLFIWPFCLGLASVSFQDGLVLAFILVVLPIAASGRLLRWSAMLGIIWGLVFLPMAWRGLSWDAFIYRQEQGIPRLRTIEAGWAGRVRAWGTARLAKALPSREAGLAAAMVYGDEKFASVDRLRIRAAGVSHLVAVSGANILFLLLLLRILLARVVGSGMLRTVAEWGGVLAIVILTGGSASVVRAGVMLILFSGARRRFRRPAFARVLLLSAMALVAIEPRRLLFDAGFHLSCLACLGLLHAQGPAIENPLAARLELRSSLFTWLWTSPFQFWFFAGISWIGLVTNVFLLFLVAWIQALTIVVLVLPGAVPIAALLRLCLSYVWLVIDTASRYASTWSVAPRAAVILMVAAYILLGADLIHRKTRTWGRRLPGFFDSSQGPVFFALVGVFVRLPVISDTAPDLVVSSWLSILEISARRFGRRSP